MLWLNLRILCIIWAQGSSFLYITVTSLKMKLNKFLYIWFYKLVMIICINGKPINIYIMIQYDLLILRIRSQTLRFLLKLIWLFTIILELSAALYWFQDGCDGYTIKIKSPVQQLPNFRETQNQVETRRQRGIESDVAEESEDQAYLQYFNSM